jgi:hypothetical protein
MVVVNYVDSMVIQILLNEIEPILYLCIPVLSNHDHDALSWQVQVYWVE